jgi:hypothetical protein
MQYLELTKKYFEQEYNSFKEELEEISEEDDDDEMIYFQSEVIINIFECNKELADKFYYTQELDDSQKYLSDVADVVISSYNKIFTLIKPLCIDYDGKYKEKIVTLTKEDILYQLNKLINVSVNSKNPFKFGIIFLDISMLSDEKGKFYSNLRIDFDYLDHNYNTVELEDFDPFNQDIDFEYTTGLTLTYLI